MKLTQVQLQVQKMNHTKNSRSMGKSEKVKAGTSQTSKGETDLVDPANTSYECLAASQWPDAGLENTTDGIETIPNGLDRKGISKCEAADTITINNSSNNEAGNNAAAIVNVKKSETLNCFSCQSSYELNFPPFVKEED